MGLSAKNKEYMGLDLFYFHGEPLAMINLPENLHLQMEEHSHYLMQKVYVYFILKIYIFYFI